MVALVETEYHLEVWTEIMTVSCVYWASTQTSNGLLGFISGKLKFLFDVKMTVLDVIMTALFFLGCINISFLPIIHPL